MRKLRPDIKMLCTATRDIVLGENQCFYSTPKAYEIWDRTEGIDPGRRIKRIPSNRVFFVQTK